MSIVIALSAVLQASTLATGTNLVCQPANGRDFSIFVPFSPSIDAARGNSAPYYRVTGLGDGEAPDSVLGSLPNGLSIFWESEDGGEIMLDVMRYSPATGTARYRLRRESSADAAIVTTTSSDGTCVTRNSGGQAQRETSQ